MRCFVEVSYDGTAYNGWQYQKNTATTVQQTIEDGLSRLLKYKTSIIGCGRTDTGVHANGYFYHVDFADDIDPDWICDKLNHVLPKDIATHRIIPVDPMAHARFDAFERSYVYRLRTYPNPFDYKYCWYYRLSELDIDLMNEAAAILLNYTEFFPFCKMGSDVKTYICYLQKAKWHFDEEKRCYEFHITSNRFLRGMIRMIVGMMINVHKGKVKLSDVVRVMDEQSRLDIDYIVPANGLCLYDIKYPYIETRVTSSLLV